MKENQTNKERFNCPICDSEAFQKIKTFNDGVIVGKCIKCNLIYTPTRHNSPEDLFGQFPIDRLKIIYEPILNGSKEHFRTRIFHKYLKKIKRYSHGKNHIDIGCA